MTLLKTGRYQARKRLPDGRRLAAYGASPEEAMQALTDKIEQESAWATVTPKRIPVSHGRRSMPTLKRFMLRVEKSIGRGCWGWGGLLTKHGYGRFHLDGK